MIVLFILLKIILYILLAIFAIVLAVLVIPFRYRIKGAKYDTTVVEGFGDWFFGAVKIDFGYNSGKGTSARFKLFGIKKDFKTQQKQVDSISKKKVGQKRKNVNKPAYSYFKYEVFQQVMHAVLKVLNHYKPEKFYIDVKAGFEDPMFTGLLYAIKSIGFGVLDKGNIQIRTVFEDEVLEGSFLIGGGIQIFYLILVAMEFVFTRPFRSILFKNIKFNIKRRLKKWRVISILVKA